MSEEVSATDTGAELTAQAEDPVSSFETLLSKQLPDAQEPEPENQPEPESDDGESPESDDPAQERFTVKIDGQEIRVSKDELIAAYQKNGAADRRLEQAAEQKKATQAEYQQVAAQRLQAINSLHLAQQVLQAQMQEQPDWQALLQSDPVAYLTQRHAFEQKQGQMQQLQMQQYQLQQQAQAEQAEAYQVHLHNQQQELLNQIPAWKDSAKAEAERTAIKQWLGKSGFNDDEISSIADARQVLVARKAMLYDQMMAKAQEAVKKVQTLPKVQRPGVQNTSSTDGRTREMQALRKTGSTAAAASVFEKLL